VIARFGGLVLRSCGRPEAIGSLAFFRHPPDQTVSATQRSAAAKDDREWSEINAGEGPECFDYVIVFFDERCARQSKEFLDFKKLCLARLNTQVPVPYCRIEAG